MKLQGRCAVMERGHREAELFLQAHPGWETYAKNCELFILVNKPNGGHRFVAVPTRADIPKAISENVLPLFQKPKQVEWTLVCSEPIAKAVVDVLRQAKAMPDVRGYVGESHTPVLQ